MAGTLRNLATVLALLAASIFAGCGDHAGGAETDSGRQGLPEAQGVPPGPLRAATRPNVASHPNSPAPANAPNDKPAPIVP